MYQQHRQQSLLLLLHLPPPPHLLLEAVMELLDFLAAPRRRVSPRGYVVYRPEISSANKIKLYISRRIICAYVNVARI